jgi:hypothetical protein
MLRFRKPRFLLPALALAVGGVWSLLPAGPTDGMQQGKADLKSAGALELGPEGVLFVADGVGAAVWALDISGVKAGSGEMPRDGIQDLDEKIASLLGAGVRDIAVKDMVAHEAGNAVYLSVMRGRGDAAVPVIIRVAAGGDVERVNLDDIHHARLPIEGVPAEDAKLYRWDSRTFTVTDLEFIDGELYIAGLSNDEFASVLRRTSWPLREDVKLTHPEIYHGAHGEWETFAPIFSFVPYDIEGTDHLLAGYLCTPLVTFPLDEVRSKDKLRGKTIAELGWGNIPTDIVPYEVDGEDWVLISNSRRGTMKMRGADIRKAAAGKGITTEVGPRTGVDYHSVPLGNVAQLDRVGDRIMILGRDMENGSLYLVARPTSRL